jgi:GGDEF domain-containing protein
MEKNEQRPAVPTAPLLAMSATAHNGLEKLSIRLAELHKDGARFSDKECEAFLAHLKAAKAASASCADLVNSMRLQPIEVPELLDEDDEEAGSPAPSRTPESSHETTPEDEMFPAGDVSDTLSGLPGRSIAIRAMQSAISVGRPRYAAVFSIDRLRYLSSRYSTDAGQQAIRHYGQYLRSKMPSDTMLFRWGGSCFLGLFDLSGPIGDARAIVDQVSAQKVKLNFESNLRSALLNLTSAGLAVALSGVGSHTKVVAELDTFVLGHSRKQPD